MRRQAAALAHDRVSGASALARRAARLLHAAARDDGKSLAGWQQDLQRVGRAIVEAQPVVGSLRTLVAEVRETARRSGSASVGAVAVRRAMERYLRRQPVTIARAAARLAAVLPRRATCLTLSSSEIVHRALVTAHRRGRLGHVVVMESRPGCEGVGLARRLAACGITVTLIVDALGPAMVRELDAVVVGADAVTATTLWHKCGTFALALAARAAGRPLFVVTTRDRVLSAALARGIRAPEVESASSHARPPRGVRVQSRLFDATPMHLVSALITEPSGAPSRGAVRPWELRRRRKRRPSRPARRTARP